MIKRKFLRGWQVLFVILMILLLNIPRASARGRVGAYLICMVPHGEDAENFSRESWGIGIRAVVPTPKLKNIISGVAGFEAINMLSQTETFTYPIVFDQETNQDYFRFFIGPQIGGHGNGFFRPYLGFNLALVYYLIETDYVVSGDTCEIRQNLSSEGHTVFGSDLTFGVDLNFSKKVSIDIGAKYLKSFSVPQQLGEGSVKIHPEYFQVYFSVAATFDLFKEKPKGGEDNTEDD